MAVARGPFSSLKELLGAAVALGGTQKAAVARSANAFVLRSAVAARELGLADSILIGHAEETRDKAREAGLDISPFELIHVESDEEAVALAVALYKEGRASLIMKGLVPTGTLLRAVLDRERGLPPKGVLSHVAVFRPPGADRLMLLTDAGVNIKPTLQRKVDILKNALAAARALGIATPRAAMLAATEKVNYPAMPATLDADLVTKMSEHGEFAPGLAAGPLALDVAVSAEAAANKGLADHPVAGRADVLCAPDIESANILYKSLSTFLGLDMAGVVVGSQVPVVVPSRGDTERSKLLSLALGVYLAARSDS